MNLREREESEAEMFEAVIFDWDGTLADTKRFVVYSFQKVLKEIGCNVSDEFIERRIGIGARNAFIDTLKVTDIPYDERTIDELVKKKISIQVRLTGNVNLFEGAIPLLQSLNGKVKMALASMSNRRVINKMLKEKRIRKYFDFVITADEVLKPKPDPEAFLRCAEKLKCSPEKCVVIEDSIFGVKAAREAEMKCIAIPAGAYSLEELRKEGPDLIVHSINEREKILSFILSRQET